MKLTLSSLRKTWLLDLDGTLVKHNGYKKGGEELLKGAVDLFKQIHPKDRIVLLTSRDKRFKASIARFFKERHLRYDQIIFNLSHGERILINDKKPSGLKTALAVNKKRDAFLRIKIVIDSEL